MNKHFDMNRGLMLTMVIFLGIGCWLPGMSGLAIADQHTVQQNGTFLVAESTSQQDQTTAYAQTKPVANPSQDSTVDENTVEIYSWLSPDAGALIWQLGAVFVLAPMLFWFVFRPHPVNRIQSPGFEVITPSEKRSFIPLTDKFHQMDFVIGIETRGQLRLSANLNRVGLSMRKYGYLLEDKNYRNALLVNRRRVRRTLLTDGDTLDLGDLTLLYRDPRKEPIMRRSGITPQDGKVHIRFDRLRGPVRKGTPVLVMEQPQSRKFYMTKNMVYIGRSEDNDLVVKAQSVAGRHVKLERVGSRFKLTDLANMGNTFVNNRRVEQRVLKEGDEIALDAYKFKFQLTNAPVRENNYAAPDVVKSAEISVDDDQPMDDGESLAEEQA